MTRLEAIRGRLAILQQGKLRSRYPVEAQDIAWLLETVDKLAAALRVARHPQRLRQRLHERSCLECSALARLEEAE